jgi:hypothetical protein
MWVFIQAKTSFNLLANKINFSIKEANAQKKNPLFKHKPLLLSRCTQIETFYLWNWFSFYIWFSSTFSFYKLWFFLCALTSYFERNSYFQKLILKISWNLVSICVGEKFCSWTMQRRNYNFDNQSCIANG